MRKVLLFLLLIPVLTFSQIGGTKVYNFLNISNSPRVSVLGGNFVSIHDDDINLALTNPSMISEGMHNNLGVSFLDYYSDINAGVVSYSRTFEKYGSFVGSLQFMSYGTFTKADETGMILGEFNAADYAINIGWGRSLAPNFTIGSNLKFIYSSYSTFKSSGLAVDVAGSYFLDDHYFSSSLIFKNIGRQLMPYTEGNIEPLPFEIQLALSKKLAKAPFRFTLLATHLEKWDLTFEDPAKPSQETDPITGEPIPEKKFEEFADKLMRHVVLGTELVFSENFNLRFGYHYQRRKELQVESRVGMIGFAWGFGLRIKKFHIDFGRSTYHLSGAPNHISITTNLSDFSKKG